MASESAKAMREEVRRLWRQRPFRPFRLYLKNGQVFDVLPPPESHLAGDTCFSVGIIDPNKPDSFGEYLEFVFYSEIDRLETEQPIAPTSG